MQAFNNDPAMKMDLVHYAATRGAELVESDGQGHRQRQELFWSKQGWCPASYVCSQKGKCSHGFYSAEVGVPVSVAYAERALFLELSTESARTWWKRFLGAIPVGADLAAADVWNQLALFVLADKHHGLVNYARTPQQIAAVRAVIELYQSNSTDKDAWEIAADEAILAASSSYDGRRMDAPEALLHSGAEAADAAHYFAKVYGDPRYASEAIARSGWVFRYKVYADFMAKQHNPRDEVQADERGMVNVGAALFASGQWMRISDQGDHAGEVARGEHYERVAAHFLRLLKDSNGVSGGTRFWRGLVARFRG